MIAQTLKLGDDLVVLVQNGDMHLILQMGKELDQIAAETVCEHVDIELLCLDIVVDVFIVIRQEVVGADDIRFCQMQLELEQVIAAAQGQCRCGEK